LRTFFWIFISFCVFSACDSSEPAPTPPPTDTTSTADTPPAPANSNVSATSNSLDKVGISAADKQELENRVRGLWEIRLFGLGKGAVLTKAQAGEWLGMRVNITQTLNCQYQDIPSARGLQNSNKAFDVLNVSVVDAGTFEQKNKVSFADIFISTAGLISIETTLTGSPFQTIYYTDKNELLFCWKGAAFLMNAL
jgi:hypothetical protein